MTNFPKPYQRANATTIFGAMFSDTETAFLDSRSERAYSEFFFKVNTHHVFTHKAKDNAWIKHNLDIKSGEGLRVWLGKDDLVGVIVFEKIDLNTLKAEEIPQTILVRFGSFSETSLKVCSIPYATCHNARRVRAAEVFTIELDHRPFLVMALSCHHVHEPKLVGEAAAWRQSLFDAGQPIPHPYLPMIEAIQRAWTNKEFEAYVNPLPLRRYSKIEESDTITKVYAWTDRPITTVPMASTLKRYNYKPSVERREVKTHGQFKAELLEKEKKIREKRELEKQRDKEKGENLRKQLSTLLNTTWYPKTCQKIVNFSPEQLMAQKREDDVELEMCGKPTMKKSSYCPECFDKIYNPVPNRTGKIGFGIRQMVFT